jgi:hypothetical protein
MKVQDNLPKNELAGNGIAASALRNSVALGGPDFGLGISSL